MLFNVINGDSVFLGFGCFSVWGNNKDFLFFFLDYKYCVISVILVLK